MALPLGASREALVSGGTPPELASKAAEELAQYETRLAASDTRLTLLTWMVGANIALTVSVLLKLFH